MLDSNKNRKVWSGKKVGRMMSGCVLNVTRSTVKKIPMSGLNVTHMENNIIYSVLVLNTKQMITGS